MVESLQELFARRDLLYMIAWREIRSATSNPSWVSCGPFCFPPSSSAPASSCATACR